MRLAILCAVLATATAGCVYHYETKAAAPNADRMEFAVQGDTKQN